MLSCDVCNGYKQHFPVVDPIDAELRLLNCTKENEFPEHIVENNCGDWISKTKAGSYHIETLGLWDEVHIRRRLHRNKILQLIDELQGPIQFQGHLNSLPAEVQNILRFLRDQLERQIPFPSVDGLKDLSALGGNITAQHDSKP